jgi:hypothetical protein
MLAKRMAKLRMEEFETNELQMWGADQAEINEYFAMQHYIDDLEERLISCFPLVTFDVWKNQRRSTWRFLSDILSNLYFKIRGVSCRNQVQAKISEAIDDYRHRKNELYSDIKNRRINLALSQLKKTDFSLSEPRELKIESEFKKIDFSLSEPRELKFESDLPPKFGQGWKIRFDHSCGPIPRAEFYFEPDPENRCEPDDGPTPT